MAEREALVLDVGVRVLPSELIRGKHAGEKQIEVGVKRR